MVVPLARPSVRSADGRIGEGDATGHCGNAGRRRHVPPARPPRLAAGCAAVRRPRPAPAAGGGADANLSAAGRAQALARRLFALASSVTRYDAGSAGVKRHEDALQPAVGGLLGAQQQRPPCIPPRSGTRRRRRRPDTDLSSNQPAAAAVGRRDDLAVLRAPRRPAPSGRQPDRVEPLKTTSGTKFFEAPCVGPVVNARAAAIAAASTPHA